MSRCLPVKKGWQFEQISSRSSFLVERVVQVAPQAQWTFTTCVIGMDSSFHGTPRAGLGRQPQLPILAGSGPGVSPPVRLGLTAHRQEPRGLVEVDVGHEQPGLAVGLVCRAASRRAARSRRWSASRRSRSSRSRSSRCSRPRGRGRLSRGTSSPGRRSALADSFRARPRGSAGGTRRARRGAPASGPSPGSASPRDRWRHRKKAAPLETPAGRSPACTCLPRTGRAAPCPGSPRAFRPDSPREPRFAARPRPPARCRARPRARPWRLPPRLLDQARSRNAGSAGGIALARGSIARDEALREAEDLGPLVGGASDGVLGGRDRRLGRLGERQVGERDSHHCGHSGSGRVGGDRRTALRDALVPRPVRGRATRGVGCGRIGSVLQEEIDDRELVVEHAGCAAGPGRLGREVERRGAARLQHAVGSSSQGQQLADGGDGSCPNRSMKGRGAAAVAPVDLGSALDEQLDQGGLRCWIPRGVQARPGITGVVQAASRHVDSARSGPLPPRAGRAPPASEGRRPPDAGRYRPRTANGGSFRPRCPETRESQRRAGDPEAAVRPLLHPRERPQRSVPSDVRPDAVCVDDWMQLRAAAWRGHLRITESTPQVCRTQS